MSQFESPVRIPSSQYYIHKSYVNSYYYVYVFLEDWLSHNIFREDPSRVFMASPEYAFRRRFELTDMSQSYEELEASSLRFPFANYWPQNSGWINDDRVAANTAYQIYLGVYEGNTQFRAASVIHKIPVTLYFDREDDARMAYSNMFFYTYNHHHYETKVPYAGNSLEIPIVLDINNLVFNPQFKESDWLQKNRIFVITAEFECRSYIIKPPAQPRYDVSVNGDGWLSDGTGVYDDGYSKYYIVDDVILNLTNQNWKLETYEGRNKSFPEKGEAGVIYTDSDNKGPNDIPKPQMYIWMHDWVDPENPSLGPQDTYVPIDNRYLRVSMTSDVEATADALRYDGTLEDKEIRLKRFGQSFATTDSVVVSWDFEDDVAYKEIEETLTKEGKFSCKLPSSYSILKFYVKKPGDSDFIEIKDYEIKKDQFISKEDFQEGTYCKLRYYLIEKIGVYTDNGAVETFLPADATSYKITNLTPGSDYLIYVNFYRVGGSVKKVSCAIKTLKEVTYYEKQEISSNQLIGISW